MTVLEESLQTPSTVARVTLAVWSTLAGMASFSSKAFLRSLEVHLHRCNPFDDDGSCGGLLHIRVHLATAAVAAAAA